MSAREPKAVEPPDDWSDLSPEELAEVKRAFDEGHEEYLRGECIPAEGG